MPVKPCTTSTPTGAPATCDQASQPTITGHELLILAAKQPIERFAVYQKVKGGGTERIALDQAVDLRTPGLERFVTLPLDQTEGGR